MEVPVQNFIVRPLFNLFATNHVNTYYKKEEPISHQVTIAESYDHLKKGQWIKKKFHLKYS